MHAVGALRLIAETHSILVLVASAVAVLLGLLGIRASTNDVVDLLLAVVAALGAFTLALLAVVLGAGRAGWLPPQVQDIHHKDVSATLTPSATLDAVKIPTTDEFKDAPHLMWSNVHAVQQGHAYEVRVLCNNVGRIAQLVPLFTWVTSTVDVLGNPIPDTDPIQTSVTQQEETIEFLDFDTGGQVQPSSGPGPFTLRMRCTEQDPIPGDREVRWRITYMDEDMERGYISECSARIVFVLGTPKVKGTPALDNTSRKQRSDDYNTFMQDKKAPSTGPRRPHQAGPLTSVPELRLGHVLDEIGAVTQEKTRQSLSDTLSGTASAKRSAYLASIDPGPDSAIARGVAPPPIAGRQPKDLGKLSYLNAVWVGTLRTDQTIKVDGPLCPTDGSLLNLFNSARRLSDSEIDRTEVKRSDYLECPQCHVQYNVSEGWLHRTPLEQIMEPLGGGGRMVYLSLGEIRQKVRKTFSERLHAPPVKPDAR